MFNSFGSAFLNSSSESDTDWVSMSPYSGKGSTRASNRTSPSSCSGSYTSAKSLQGYVAFKPTPDGNTRGPKVATNSLALDAEFPTGCRLLNFSSCSTDSNYSTLDGSDVEESDSIANFQRYIYSHRPLDMSKYIPVKDYAALYVPECSFHKVYQQEWKEAQKAYEFQHAKNNLSKARVSKSDNFVCVEKHKPSSRRNSKMAKLFSKVFRHKSRVITDFKSACFLTVPKQNNPRFNNVTNQNFIEVNVEHDPDFVAILYVQSSSNPNSDLCHIKTELVVAAMLNYFYPYSNVQCLWLKNLQEKLLKMTVGQIVKSKFHKTIHLRQFEAALVLSKGASSLIRHRDSVFTQSIALALDITSGNLIVLVDEDKAIVG